MSYTQKLNEIRNSIHKDIVVESTVRTCLLRKKGDDVLQLKNPVKVRTNTVGFVCCETGLLLSDDGDTIVRYQDLTVEELSVLHMEIVESKQYSFTNNLTLLV
jgi:hypothetical protein